MIVNLDDAYLITKIISGILLICGIILGGLWKWCPRIKRIFEGKKTIIIVNNDNGYTNFWHRCSQNGKPIIQIECRFMVTNITDHPVALAHATWKGAIKGTIESSTVSVKDHRSTYWGSYDIPPKTKTNVSVDFLISPTKMPKTGATINLHIGITDQFGNTHWIKNVALRSG